MEPDLLDDLAIDHLQHRGAGEVHLAAGRSRQPAHQKVTKRRTRMNAATLPLTDDVVAFCDQIRCAPEIQVGERGSKIRRGRDDINWSMI